MKLIVNPHTIEIDKTPVNEKEINITEVEFEFAEELEDDYVKEAYFTKDNKTYKKIIVNNKTTIPSEVLETFGQVEVGVVIYKLVNDEVFEKRYNPSPAYFTTLKGSLRDAENPEPITPTDKEQIEQALAYLEATKAEKTEIPDVSEFITKDVNNLTFYTLASDTGHSLEASIDNSTYVLTLTLKNIVGEVLNTQTIDLPLETMVVSGSYDNVNKTITLVLQNGNTIEIPVGSLVSGLQEEITTNNKLSSDLVYDTNNSNKFVSSGEKETWNSKYDKPTTGIPKTDLSSEVQTSLGKADTALQNFTETDPVFSSSASANITGNDIENWNNKSDFSGNYNDLSNKPSIPSKTSDLNNDSGFIDKSVNNLDNYTKTSDLSSVATSGNYADLSNKPTIPDELSDLSDDSTHRLVSDTEKSTWNSKSDFSGSYNDLTDKPTIPTVPTNVSAFTNDAGYLTQHQDISGKLDTSAVKTTTNTTQGNVYDVTYINTMLGDIESLLGGI